MIQFLTLSEPLLGKKPEGESIVLWISAWPFTLAVCWAWFMQKAHAFGVPLDVQWGIYSLDESVPRKCALLLGG